MILVTGLGVPLAVRSSSQEPENTEGQVSHPPPTEHTFHTWLSPASVCSSPGAPIAVLANSPGSASPAQPGAPAPWCPRSPSRSLRAPCPVPRPGCSLRVSPGGSFRWKHRERARLLRRNLTPFCLFCSLARSTWGARLCQRRAPWGPRPSGGDRTRWTPRPSGPAWPPRPVRPLPVRLLRQPRRPPGECEGPLEDSGRPGDCGGFLKLERRARGR